MHKKLIIWLMKTKLYKWIVLKLIPKLKYPTIHTKLNGQTYNLFYEILKPGDVLLSKNKWSMSSLLVPGDFSHAAFCVSKDGKNEIIEAVAQGVRTVTFYDFYKDCSDIAILRGSGELFTPGYIARMCHKAIYFYNNRTGYDYMFEFGVDALYCSELIAHIDFDQKFGFSYMDLAGLGRYYISPTGILHGKNIEVIVDSRKH